MIFDPKTNSITCFYKTIFFVGLFGILNTSCSSTGTYNRHGSVYEYCNQAVNFDPNCTHNNINNMHRTTDHDPFGRDSIHKRKHKPFGHDSLHKRKHKPFGRDSIHKRKHKPFGRDSIHKRKHKPFGRDSIHKRKHKPFGHDSLHKRKHKPFGHDQQMHKPFRNIDPLPSSSGTHYAPQPNANPGGINSFHIPDPPSVPEITPPVIETPSFNEPFKPYMPPPPPLPEPPRPSFSSPHANPGGINSFHIPDPPSVPEITPPVIETPSFNEPFKPYMPPPPPLPEPPRPSFPSSSPWVPSY